MVNHNKCICVRGKKEGAALGQLPIIYILKASLNILGVPLN